MASSISLLWAMFPEATNCYPGKSDARKQNSPVSHSIYCTESTARWTATTMCIVNSVTWFVVSGCISLKWFSFVVNGTVNCQYCWGHFCIPSSTASNCGVCISRVSSCSWCSADFCWLGRCYKFIPQYVLNAF